MEIQFCDLCNESVPEGDLAAGRAYLRKGRVVCSDCDAAMGGGGEAIRIASTFSHLGSPQSGASATDPAAGSSPAASGHAVPRGAGGGGVLVGLLTLIFAPGGFYVVLERMTAMDHGATDVRRDLERGIESTIIGLSTAMQSVAMVFIAPFLPSYMRRTGPAALISSISSTLNGRLNSVSVSPKSRAVFPLSAS